MEIVFGLTPAGLQFFWVSVMDDPFASLHLSHLCHVVVKLYSLLP